MALRTPEKPDEYNPTPNEVKDDFQNIIDYNYSPGDQRATEERAIDDAAEDIKNNSGSTAEDLINSEQNAGMPDKKGDDSLENQENRGDASWKNNTSSSKGNVTRRFKGAAKKRGAILLVTATFAMMGFVWSLMAGAMGIVQIKENMVSKISQRGADALERRKAHVLAKKLKADFTKGCTVNIKCRYKGFSSKEIKKFNKRAAQYGWKMEKTGRSVVPPFRNKIELQKLSKDGSVQKRITAKDIDRTMRYDASFRQASNAFYKGIVEFHAGRAGSYVLAKSKVFRGKIKAPKGEGDTDEKKDKFSLRKMARQAGAGITGSVEAAKIATDVATNPGDVDPSDSISDEVKEIVDKDVEQEKSLQDDFTKDGSAPIEGSDAEQDRYKETIKDKIASKGGGISGLVGNPLAVAQPVCIARMIAAAANSAKSVLQAVQLIRFSMQFVVLADQIKAGDADSDTMKSVGLLMGMLSTKDERGYTAFDSLGYNWVMSNNSTVKGTPNENIGRYQNGGYTAGTLGPAITAVTSSSELKAVCKVAMSKTVTIIGIGLIAIPGIGSIFKGGISAASKEAIKAVFSRNIKSKMDDIIDKQIAKTVLKQKLSTLKKVAGSEALFSAFFYYGLPPLINNLSKSLAGTVITGDEKGTDAGNALVSGFGATTAQTGKAQGMMPLNPDRAVATDNFAYENQLKLAKEDGINQFDFTNRFSFSNQFAINILPLQAKLSSLTSLPTALSNISSSALSLTFSKSASAAIDKKKQYTYCTDADEVYKEHNIATDPMCNPIYGLPAAVKDIDPEEVLNYLSDNELINEDGEPQGEFTEFIEKCITSQTPYGEDDNICLRGGGLEERSNYLDLGKDGKYAMMRLYCIDSGIDVDMNEGEGVSCLPKVDGNSGTAGDSSTAGNTTGTGKWSGQTDITQDLKDFLDMVAQHTSYEPICTTSTGGTHAAGSDHYSGNACDFGSVANNFGTNNAQPGENVPRGDELAAAALIASGMDAEDAKEKAKTGLRPGTDDTEVTINGKKFRVQVIWKSDDHYDHVHIGIKAK